MQPYSTRTVVQPGYVDGQGHGAVVPSVQDAQKSHGADVEVVVGLADGAVSNADHVAEASSNNCGGSGACIPSPCSVEPDLAEWLCCEPLAITSEGPQRQAESRWHLREEWPKGLHVHTCREAPNSGAWSLAEDLLVQEVVPELLLRHPAEHFQEEV